jgi:4-amino-4-deoxy-L-arabinose transferase-like glycosyltransferase
MGLNEISTRLPNAIFGSLAVLSIYLLTSKITNKKVGIVSSFLLAISPWHISLSRGAFEANLIVFFLPLIVYVWCSQKYTIFSLLLALNFYSYHTSRYLTPLLLITLYIYNRPKLTKSLIANLVILGLLLVPGSISLLNTGSLRATDVAITSPTDNWKSVSDRRFEAIFQGMPDSISRLFSNKLLYVGSQFTQNYLTYLSPYFLFVQGAGETTYGMISGSGVLYIMDTLGLMAFVYLLVKKPQKKYIFLLGLLLISLLPASLAKGTGLAANRAIPMLIPLLVVISIGIYNLYKQAYLFKLPIKPILLILYAISFIYFAESYIFHSLKPLSRGMNFGMKEAVLRSTDLARGRPIMFSRNLSEPHIFVAFYLNQSPEAYQADINNYSNFQSKGFKYLDQLGSYSIAGVRYGNLDFSLPNSLLVGRPSDFPGEYPFHFQINYPDSSLAIQVSQTQNK